MAPNIEDSEVERLAIRLTETNRAERLRAFLETEGWPRILPELRERGISKEEREEILGYGPEGV